MLSLGIDGWKCDGTDPYLLELVVAKGQGGVVSRAEYSDDYYNDFFDYSRAKLGDNRLIMSRPVDGSVLSLFSLLPHITHLGMVHCILSTVLVM